MTLFSNDTAADIRKNGLGHRVRKKNPCFPNRVYVGNRERPGGLEGPGSLEGLAQKAPPKKIITLHILQRNVTIYQAINPTRQLFIAKNA